MARKSKTETNANPELVLALDLLEKEKGIKKEFILDAIKASMEAAYKRNFTNDEKIPHENSESEHRKEDISVDIDVIFPHNVITTAKIPGAFASNHSIIKYYLRLLIFVFQSLTFLFLRADRSRVCL